MSTQRAGSAVEAGHRSVHPGIPGVPWWAALVIAATATAIGYAIDAGLGHKELTEVFAALYVSGCVIAVLAVRQSGVFTAVIQPPLILFCAVPAANWLFHSGKVGNLKDLLINCGYPLIERFPLMLGTAGGVLLIGLIRWYFGLSHRLPTHEDTADEAGGAAGSKSFLGGLGGVAAKFASILGSGADDETNEADETRSGNSTRAARRPSGAKRAARSGSSAQRSTRTRSRHARPSLEEDYEPSSDRWQHAGRRGPASARDYQPVDPARRSRRRPRPPADPDHSRRGAYERPAGRSSRFDPYGERFSPYDAPYEPYEEYDSPRRRTPPPGGPNGGPNGVNPTHHPISQVRYRGSSSRDDRREPRDAARRRQIDDWEYDG